jgi:predicted nucleotide-binding protein (sugar kinase/HSP70/actin superfamily)
MKATFPHMGNMYISVKVLLDAIGADYIIPPLCNKNTLEHGVVHSPEFICLPFKTTLGNFMQSIDKGADLIIFGGGCGLCRYGYYGDLHAEILKSLGYNIKFVCLDTGAMTFKDMLIKLKPLTGGKSTISIIKGIACAVRTVFQVDNLYQLANYTRCREINKGDTDKIMKNIYRKVNNAKGYKAIIKVIISIKKELKIIKIDRNFKPLKIAIIGEIYAATEPFVNLDIERKLGNMGVEVHNNLAVSTWIRDHFIKNILPGKSKNSSHEAGKEFMKTDDIGGHGLETIGNAILSAKKRYDGVIHLYPFTCMPEIIAQSTFSAIQSKYKIPIMTLILDEMTGETGYMTRIEAFLDMLEIRREISKVLPVPVVITSRALR